MSDWIVLLFVGMAIAVLSPLAIVISYDWAFGALFAGFITMGTAFAAKRWGGPR